MLSQVFSLLNINPNIRCYSLSVEQARGKLIIITNQARFPPRSNFLSKRYSFLQLKNLFLFYIMFLLSLLTFLSFLLLVLCVLICLQTLYFIGVIIFSSILRVSFTFFGLFREIMTIIFVYRQGKISSVKNIFW